MGVSRRALFTLQVKEHLSYPRLVVLHNSMKCSLISHEVELLPCRLFLTKKLGGECAGQGVGVGRRGVRGCLRRGLVSGADVSSQGGFRARFSLFLDVWWLQGGDGCKLGKFGANIVGALLLHWAD